MPWATLMVAFLFTVTRPAELSRQVDAVRAQAVVVTVRLSKLTVGPQFASRMPSALLPDVVTARSLNWTWPVLARSRGGWRPWFPARRMHSPACPCRHGPPGCRFRQARRTAHFPQRCNRPPTPRWRQIKDGEQQVFAGLHEDSPGCEMGGAPQASRCSPGLSRDCGATRKSAWSDALQCLTIRRSCGCRRAGGNAKCASGQRAVETRGRDGGGRVAAGATRACRNRELRFA